MSHGLVLLSRNLMKINEEVAEAVGGSQKQISDFELGRTPTDIRIIYRIARYYGVEAKDIWPESLILGEEEEPKGV